MQTATTKDFKTKVLESKLPTLVDFNADWCGPCQAQAPMLEQLAADADNNYQIISVNIDDNPELAEQYEVSSIPCLVLFKDGAEVTRKIGLTPKSTLAKILKKA